MYPILLKLGPVTIHTYGFLIAIGFLCAVQVAKRLAVQSNVDQDRIVDLGFWCLMVGFLGARILFIYTRLDTFVADPISMFKVWEGGLVFLGGPLAVFPFLIWYFKKYRLPAWKTADILAPALTLGHGFGRFGCLAAGCCYGRVTGSHWGVRLYSDLVDPHLRGIPLHPTQLYEAGALFILFGGLIWIFKRKEFDGQVALSYLLAYPIIRSIIEIYRGDTIRGFVIEGLISTSQFLSFLMFLGALIVLVLRLKQVRSES